MILLPSFDFIRFEIQELWRWAIPPRSLRVGKKLGPNRVNKTVSTEQIDNKACTRKDKSLVAFNAKKKYFSNLAENTKFTFYYFLRLYFYHYTFPVKFWNGMAVYQAAQPYYE